MDTSLERQWIDMLVKDWGIHGFQKIFLEVERDKNMIEKNRAIVPQKLYVMSRGDGWYKIGVSIDPESRLRGVQTGSNVVLKLEKIYDYDNAFLLEQFLLSRFLDRIGEWVYIGDNGVEKIDDILNKYSI